MITAAVRQNAAYDIGLQIREEQGPRQTVETERDNRPGTLAAGKSLMETIRDSNAPRDSTTVVPQGDTVTISEEGRSKQKAMAGGTEEENAEGAGVQHMAQGEGGTEANAADQAKQQILDQIKQVKEQLEEAKQKLSQATAAAADDGAAAAEETASPDGTEGTQAQGASQSGTDANPEMKSMQLLVNQLEMQLQTLNQQLLQASKGGRGAPALGTAGIGGEGDGLGGGMGERISVSA